MALSPTTNIFAGNPLDRVSERRADADWLRARLDDPESLAVAIWNGRILVEDAPDGHPEGAAARTVDPILLQHLRHDLLHRHRNRRAVIRLADGNTRQSNGGGGKPEGAATNLAHLKAPTIGSPRNSSPPRHADDSAMATT